MKLVEKRPPENDLIKDIFATDSEDIIKFGFRIGDQKASKRFIRNQLTITILLACHTIVQFRHRQQTRNRLGGTEGNIVLFKFIPKCI